MANATEKQGGPFIYAEGQNDAGQPDGTVSVSAHFISRAESAIEDLIHNAELQHRATCWHKGMNSDLVDGKHASYLTSSVNGTDIDHPNFNDTTPAAAGGGTNVKFQVSGSDVSAYLPAGSAGPVDAQYVTLATNGTLTNERVLTPGTAIDITDAGAGSTVTIDVDLNELGVGTPAAADTFIFIDADDSVAKKGSAAATLTAIGGASATTALTAAAVLADKAVVVGAAADRTTVKSDFTMTHDGTNVVGLAAGSTISFGANALSTTGTAATAAHTETVANVTASNRSGVDSTKGPWRQTYFKEMSTSGGGVQTVMDVPIPTSCSATVSVRLYGIVSTSLNRVFLAIHELHVTDNAGTPTIQLDQPVIDNDPAGIGYAISFTVSTTNVRIQINDATNTLRLGCSATIEWRNSTA